MLTFLHSIFAWALLAATIPLLIHLLTRKKLKKVSFSTLQFLKRMQKAKIRQIRLKQILLLLLRTLIIVFLVVAFMRPSLSNKSFDLGKNARGTTVFIIDNSLSMAATPAGESLLSVAKKRAVEFLALAKPGDDVAVIELSETARIVYSASFGENVSTVSQPIQDIKQTDGTSSLEDALKLAQSIIAEKRNINSAIFVFSDQKFKGFSEEPIGGFQNTQLYLVDISEPVSHNLSVSNVEVMNQIFEVQRVVTVKARIINSGKEEEKNNVVTLLVNNKRVAQSSVSLKAGEEKSASFKFVPSEPGLQHLKVEVENDQLKLDNQAYNLFAIQKTLKVLLCTNEPGQSRFIRYALGNKAKSTSFKIVEIKPEALATTDLSQFDVMVTIDVPSFTESELQKMETFVRDGGGIILFPGDEVDFRNYDASIFSRFRLGSVIETIGAAAKGTDIIRLNELDLNHPLFAGIFEKQTEKQKIDSPIFHFIPRMTPHVSARVLAQFANNSPFIVENKLDKGTIYLCLTSADESWSDFVYKPLFAPIIDRLVRLAGQASKNNYALISVGETPYAFLNFEKSAAFSLINSRGINSFVKPVVEHGKYKIQLQETRHSGYYQVVQDDDIRFTWVANYDLSEVLNNKIDQAQLEKVLPGVDVVFINDDENSVQKVYEQRFGTEIWHLFLLFAFIGLLVEMLIYRAKPEVTTV
ncbi:MAG: VWA domain-containing protein [Deferribacteres bacterium]|nr:VWA domain-containing protein [candidate division KSB1 bacterium]MCB9502966.1 VWA domain-containing protein [Deferribacteres bacterium]